MLYNESTNEVLIFTSDGTHTIGYVDNKPAEWDGNYAFPENDTKIRLKDDFDTFGVNFPDEYIVNNGEWIKNASKEG